MSSHSEKLKSLSKFYKLSNDLQNEKRAQESKEFFAKKSFEDFLEQPYNPKSDSQKILEEDNSENRH